MSFDETWEKIFSERPWGKYPNEDVIRFVMRHFSKAADRKSIRILDLGCGGGAHAWFLAREGFDVYALDGSESAVGQTKKLLEQNNLSAQLQVGDMNRLDYPSDFFDAVVDNNSIQHNRWADILKTHLEIRRVLKAEGRLLSIMLNEGTTGSETAEKIEEGTFKNFKKGLITTGVLAHLTSKAELDILSRSLQDVSVETVTRETLGATISHYVLTAQNRKL